MPCGELRPRAVAPPVAAGRKPMVVGDANPNRTAVVVRVGAATALLVSEGIIGLTEAVAIPDGPSMPRSCGDVTTVRATDNGEFSGDNTIGGEGGFVRVGSSGGDAADDRAAADCRACVLLLSLPTDRTTGGGVNTPQGCVSASVCGKGRPEAIARACRARNHASRSRVFRARKSSDADGTNGSTASPAPAGAAVAPNDATRK